MIPLTARMIAASAMITALIAATAANAAHPNPALDFSPTPGVACRAQDKPETIQGRVPAADYASGRAAQGYTCNTDQVSHIATPDAATGGHGGYRVHRYTDSQGNTCAFYDTTLLFPANARAYPTDTGVRVLDLSDPARPVQTATLRTPAMQSPHESFDLNRARGFLGAVFANPAAHAGQFDLYDVRTDCRRPQLMASLPMGVLGHEGSFSADGNTYWASSLYAHTLTAIDTSIPVAPRTIWTSTKWQVHGMNTSPDGNLLYITDAGRANGEQFGEAWGSPTKGLTVLDVSQIQARALNPQVTRKSHLTWPHVGTPQTAIPFTRDGGSYLLEVDEFGGPDNVGAVRIINVDEPAAPFVVSNLRLAVNNLDRQTDPSQKADPGASNSLGGYRAHYCSLPSPNEPKIVACTFILSGLRVFDISDLLHPREIAYFNKPSTAPALSTTGYGPQGSYAMAQPAIDVARKQVWYTDGNSGFYVVQVDPSVWPDQVAVMDEPPTEPDQRKPKKAKLKKL